MSQILHHHHHHQQSATNLMSKSDDQKVTIEKLLDSKLHNYMENKFGLLLDQKLTPLNQTSELELTKRITDLETRVKVLEKSLKEKNSLIENLNIKLSDKAFTDKLNQLEDRIDSHQANILCDNLIISGPKVPPMVSATEDTVEIAANLLKQCSLVNFEKKHIIWAYRVGKRRPTTTAAAAAAGAGAGGGGGSCSPPPPPPPDNNYGIKLRLDSRILKHEILKSCDVLRNDSSKGLYLKEELTHRRYNLFYKLRMMKKENCRNMILYTRDGSIKARTSSVTKTFTINNKSQYKYFTEQNGLSSSV